MDNNKITHEVLYQFFILKVLIELGGSGERWRILDKIKRNYLALLTKKDLEDYGSGHGERWQNHISFARQYLKEQGYLRKNSLCGIWEITGEGRQKYKEWLETLQ